MSSPSQLSESLVGTGYYEQYFKDYAYRHVPVALGLNETRNIGFSFSIEEVGWPVSFQYACWQLSTSCSAQILVTRLA